MEITIKLIGRDGRHIIVSVDGTPVGLIKHLSLEADAQAEPKLLVQFGSYYADNADDQARIDTMLAANRAVLARLSFVRVLDSDTEPHVPAVEE